MKQIIILILLFAFPILSTAQEAENKSTKTNSWNPKPKELIHQFNTRNKHLNLVYKDGQYGFTDKKGKLIRDYQYENVKLSTDKIIKVKKSINNVLTDFLINTLGKEYKVAYRIEDLDASIQALDLKSNGLDKVPTEIAQHPQLKVLMLSDNSITELNTIEGLINLEHLDLSYNKLTRIEGLDKLTTLNTLNLHNNQLRQIEGLDKLMALQELYLGNNELTKIEDLEKLTTLRELDLSYNDTALQPDIETLKMKLPDCNIKS
ncbi:MAG: leucine-rich repeat domain-containing protein [Saprospiraceae bacterium]